MTVAEQNNSIYMHIGQRIKERRKLLKLSQAELGQMMGFSYQQMQKYENGRGQLSAGKLLVIAKILNVKADYFYEGWLLEEPIGKRRENDIIQRDRARPLRILLVEDKLTDVIIFQKALSNKADQVQIEVVSDANKVLDYLRGHDPCPSKMMDIIILELSLPKPGGLELLKSIKKNPQTMAVPVLILTNSIEVTDMMNSYKYGAAGFVQKSADLQDYAELWGSL